MKIGAAGLLAAMFFWNLPGILHQLKHGPKGSQKQWLNASLLIAGVVLFVVFLMYSV